jgi:hypothetical protein
MRLPLAVRRIILAPALGLALAVAVAACSSGSSPSSSAPSSSAPASSAPASSAPASSAAAPASDSAATAAAITANWEKFFSASTPTSQRVALLQNGTQFAAAISSLSHLVSGLGATVTSVTVTSPTGATVKYNLTAAGKSLLPGQTGQAVYVNGTWKVADASLCGLLKLVPGGSTPAACNSAG